MYIYIYYCKYVYYCMYMYIIIYIYMIVYIYICILLWIRGYHLDIVNSSGLCSCQSGWRRCRSQRSGMRSFLIGCVQLGVLSQRSPLRGPWACWEMFLRHGSWGIIITVRLFAPPTSVQLCCSGAGVHSTSHAAQVHYRIPCFSWIIIQCRRLAKSTSAQAIEANRCLYTIQTLSFVA